MGVAIAVLVMLWLVLVCGWWGPALMLSYAFSLALIIGTPSLLASWAASRCQPSDDGARDDARVRLILWSGLLAFGLLACAPGSPFAGQFPNWLRVLEPWPLSLSQGPDTSLALEGYRNVLGESPPPNVDRIYYKHYSGRDSSDYLRFESCFRTELARMAKRFRGISRVTPSRPKDIEAGLLQWWLSPDPMNGGIEEWEGGGGNLRLWRDPERCLYYVRIWSY